MAAEQFDEWMSGFGADGPQSTDLDELAQRLCSRVCTATSAARLFSSLNTCSENLNDTISWKGVSVKWFLETFMQFSETKAFIDFNCPLWFVRNHCIPQMLPEIQNRESLCLVDCVENLESPSPLVDKPTVFISYTGNYTLKLFAELVGDLEGHFMWSDMFCVDQLAWKKQDEHFKDGFMYRLKENIQSIGFTALFLRRWDHPMDALGMIWVLWEIFATVESSARLEILFTESEHDRFLYEGLGSQSGAHEVLKSLGDIDARNAKGWNEEDRIRILRIMEVENGVSRVNSQVIKRVQEWLVDTGVSVFGEAVNIMTVEEDGEEAVIDAYKMGHNMANLYRNIGNLAKAEALQRKAVQGLRESLGNQHPFTLTALNNLAGFLRMQQKDMHEAGLLYREVFEQRSMQLGEASLDTLHSANNLGNFLTDHLKFDEAKKIFSGAIALLPGIDLDEDMAFDLRMSLTSNLATVHSFTEELAIASDLFSEVLELRRFRLSSRHPRTIKTISNLAGVLFRMEDYETANSMYRECLEIEREIYGDSNVNTLQATHNLSLVLLKTDELEEAEKLLRCAVNGRRCLLGSNHRDTLKSIAGLAESLERQGRDSEAQPLYREAFELRNTVLGDKHPETLSSALTLALVLIRMEDMEGAAPLCEKAYDGYKEIYGPSHPLTEKARWAFSATHKSGGQLSTSGVGVSPIEDASTTLEG